MYINFWYPILRSEDLGPGKPEKVKVLGCNLVAFRDDEGKAHVLSDTCTHRGASLGGGWSLAGKPRIVNNCIVCPYHGWEFGGDGECKNIPSIGYGTKPPPRAKVDSYPVQEKYGLIHVFLGDLPEAERPPIIDIPEQDLHVRVIDLVGDLGRREQRRHAGDDDAGLCGCTLSDFHGRHGAECDQRSRHRGDHARDGLYDACVGDIRAVLQRSG